MYSSSFSHLLNHAAHIRPFLTALAAIILMYWAHRSLQDQYHRRCKADLIRVVLFNQSTLCSHISGVLQIVEIACDQAMKQLTGHVIGVLSGGLLAAGAGGAAAGWLQCLLDNAVSASQSLLVGRNGGADADPAPPAAS